MRLAFRFLFAYLVLYNLPFPVGWIPGTSVLSDLYAKPWPAIAGYVATHVLRIDRPVLVEVTGSGDRTYDYVLLLCIATLAALATIIWSLLDRRRADYRTLAGALRVYVRYVLAATMLSYGTAKILKSQFPFPGPDVLLQSYGQSSPMRLLWTFMGYSTSYTIFAGVAEALGGVLLFARRTTTLGALIAVAVMSNIVMMNFSYDVPVKMYSLHLLAQALFLVAPDAERLARFFVLNRATEPQRLERRRFARRGMNRAVVAAKVVLVTLLVGYWTHDSFVAHQTYGDGAPKPPLFGAWEVEAFTRGGALVPPLTTEATRWRWLGVNASGNCVVKRMDDSSDRFRVAQNDSAKTLDLTPRVPGGDSLAFAFERPEEGRLILRGEVEGEATEMALRRMAPTEWVLLSRGFRWISEGPYNR